jgi:hypothetical protein
MLKYHNFDNEDVPIDIIFNSTKLTIDDALGREMISAMRNTYFGLFDLITLTDKDDIKKRLMKNKIKSITIDIWGQVMKDYSESENPEKSFIDALGSTGLIIENIKNFIGFSFSDDKEKDYFMSEALKLFSTNIHSLSILQKETDG